MSQQGTILLLSAGVLGCVLVVAALLSCGGTSAKSTAANSPAVTSTEGTNTETHPSAPDVGIVATADGICGRLNDTLRTTPINLHTTQDVVAFATGRAVAERQALTELEQLHPPGTIAGAWQQVIAHRTKLIELLHELARAAADGRTDREAAIDRAYSSVSVRLGAAAKQAGLRDCAAAG